ncbi:hypothetical protein EV132_12460 [Rhizobium sullae]|uniref:Alpha/beta hydrolase family protein n=1 Tax=Rhizobium sullae TaxID=50338 RepID=A0A4R3PUD4_RHISU|nr:hypothetical protein EV132_12460 [Rhizobium sullae]
MIGHDIGGQIVYAYLRAFPNAVSRAAILPGVPPWDKVIRNPRLWHFAFHAVPDLPERLVAGRQQEYFDFFFEAISARPAAVSQDARRRYAHSYATPSSLKAGFDWYRGFPRMRMTIPRVAAPRRRCCMCEARLRVVNFRLISKDCEAPTLLT